MGYKGSWQVERPPEHRRTTVIDFLAALTEWQRVAAEAKRAAAKEMELRKALFQAAFPTPTEGVNKLELSDGRIVKGTHKVNRTVDQAAVAAALEPLRKLGQNDVTPEEVFPVKYDLSMKAVKKLTAEGQLAASKAIVAKPGSPTLEVI